MICFLDSHEAFAERTYRGADDRFCSSKKFFVSSFQIRIPVDQVTNITKRKTAIIIPNAVGIVTGTNKVVSVVVALSDPSIATGSRISGLVRYEL